MSYDMFCTYIYGICQSCSIPPIIYTDTTHSNGEHISGCSYHFLYLPVCSVTPIYLFCKNSLLKCWYQNGTWPSIEIQKCRDIAWSQQFLSKNISSRWFQPIWKTFVKLEICLKEGWTIFLKPPPGILLPSQTSRCLHKPHCFWAQTAPASEIFKSSSHVLILHSKSCELRSIHLVAGFLSWPQKIGWESEKYLPAYHTL